MRINGNKAMNIKKISLISNSLCFSSEPLLDEEIEQRLTINNKGRIWFSGYNYGQDVYSVDRRKQLTISESWAMPHLQFLSASAGSKSRVKLESKKEKVGYGKQRGSFLVWIQPQCHWGCLFHQPFLHPWGKLTESQDCSHPAWVHGKTKGKRINLYQS